MRPAYPAAIEIAQLEVDEHAYILVEQARLRCEHFRDSVGTVDERVSLVQIHRELGMAGWLVSAELDPARRRQLLAAAHQHAITSRLHPRQAHALAAVVIEGEDAVAAALARDADNDHMHLAHLHLISALEQLAALI